MNYDNCTLEEAMKWQRTDYIPKIGLNCNSVGWIQRSILINENFNKKILDVACGNGLCIDNGVINGKKIKSELYTGIDVSQVLIEAAKIFYPDYLFECGNATNLPYNDNTFQCSISVSLLEHLPTITDCQKVLLEMFRVSQESIYISWHHAPGNFKTTYNIVEKCFFGTNTYSNRYNLYELMNDVYPIDKIQILYKNNTGEVWKLKKLNC